MNKIIQMLRRGMVQGAVEGGTVTLEILPKNSILVPVDMGVERFTLKTIDVVADKVVPFYVEIFESSSMTKSMYNSDIVMGRNYDIVDMIYISQEPDTNCYVYIENSSDFPATYTVAIRGLELK